MNDIKVVAFDADDTLWVNEPFFREAEQEFFELLKDYLPAEEVSKELYKTEMETLSLYGYGIKGFVLSMIETAMKVSKNKVTPQTIEKMIALGKEMLEKPVELLDGVEEVLDSLNSKYKLVVATKGDLLDQERKIKKSGLEHYFGYVEVMSDKRSDDYRYLTKQLNCAPENFLMIGNSLKSDIIPVLDMGGYAIHVPFSVT